MLLYIHVPFCRKRCHYCAFYSTILPADPDQVIEVYTKTLLAEIDLWNKKLADLGYNRPHIESIFFGGGTPSILPAKNLGRIMKTIKKYFDIAPGAEISLEANPESLLKYGYTEDLKNIGINRISIGVQSLDDDVLCFLGRPHTVKEALSAYDAARVSGFSNINLDFIWALPEQRLRLWLEQLKEVVKLKPEHISCYSLTIEEDTPLEKALHENDIALPEEKEQAMMYMHGVSYLESEGFLHYEISNFARMGYKCRHNLGYWEGMDYLGFGPSASSTMGARRWKNSSSLKGWSDAVQAKTCGDNVEILDKRTKILELIMLSLRTERGLELARYKKLSGRDFSKDSKQLLTALRKNNLIKLRKGFISLTTEGMLVSNSIIEHLFRITEEILERETI